MKPVDRAGQKRRPTGKQTWATEVLICAFSTVASFSHSKWAFAALYKCSGRGAELQAFPAQTPMTPDESAKAEEMMLRLEGDKRRKALFGGGATPSTAESNSPTTMLNHHRPQRRLGTAHAYASPSRDLSAHRPRRSLELRALRHETRRLRWSKTPTQGQAKPTEVLICAFSTFASFAHSKWAIAAL